MFKIKGATTLGDLNDGFPQPVRWQPKCRNFCVVGPANGGGKLGERMARRLGRQFCYSVKWIPGNGKPDKWSPSSFENFINDATQWFLPNVETMPFKDPKMSWNNNYLYDRSRYLDGEIEVTLTDGGVYRGKFKKITSTYKSFYQKGTCYRIDLLPHGHGSFTWGENRRTDYIYLDTKSSVGKGQAILLSDDLLGKKVRCEAIGTRDHADSKKDYCSKCKFSRFKEALGPGRMAPQIPTDDPEILRRRRARGDNGWVWRHSTPSWATVEGGKYVGNWKKGYMHGEGTMTMPNGDEYVGMWRYDRKCGTGTATLANGEKYEGNWVNDQINGQGTFTWTNGEKYSGEWVNNQRNGKGSMTYADDTKYVGEWVDDQINGHGTMTYPDGSKYVGEWKDGKRNGHGSVVDKNGCKEYDGEWADGNENGKGKMTYADGRVYDGEWVDGKENGKGKMTYPDGTKYEGTWKDGESEHLNERSCDKKSCETSIYPVLEPQPGSYEPSAPPLPAQEEHTCECVICMDGEANYACIPCGHKCLCSSSACSSVKNCPICRQEITGTLRIY